MPPPRSIVACLLAVAFAAAPAGGQYDPAAPEPIGWTVGALLLAAPEAPSWTEQTFTGRAGGAIASIVVLAVDAAAQAPSFAPAPPPRRVDVPDRARADSPEVAAALARATGAWIVGPPERIGAAWSGTLLADALVALMQRGGVVAALGGSADALGARLVAADGSAASGLGLLPGSVVLGSGDRGTRDARLKEFLPRHRELVGFSIDRRSTLVLEGRRLALDGAGRAQALIAPWRGKPWRVESLRGDAWIDLVALSRAAVARTLPPFPPADPPPPFVPAGALVLAGGGGVPDGLLERFIELAGGPDALIVCLPALAGERVPDEPADVVHLRRAGARNVIWLHTKDRNRANGDEALLGPLRRAGGVWFGGGRHWHFVDSYQDTTAHLLMQELLARGGVIGGASAGASIQSDYMVRGDPRSNHNIIAEGYERGLGFLTGAAVDQHFSQRGRQRQMADLMSTYPQLLGIGIDERAALVVRGSVAEVVSDRPGARVYFYGRNRATHARDQRFVALGAGAHYDMRRRRPLDGPAGL